MTVSAYTPTGFRLIDFNSDNWHSDDWANWNLLDAILTAVAATSTPLPTVGGTANAITLNYTPDKVLANGLQIVFIPTASPTGATTVNVDGTGVKNLKVLNSAIITGDIVAGDVVTAIYDGTDFQVRSPVRRTSGPITITISASGATADANADEIVIHNNVHAGISILTAAGQKGTLAFGDPADGDSGRIVYDHAADSLATFINGTPTTTLTAISLRLEQGKYLQNMTGANDYTMVESSADVIRLGSSGSATGLFIDMATGIVTISSLGASTVSGNLTRSGKGIHPYFNDALMTGGRIFMQASGADPTSLPGDIVFEW